MKTLFITLTVIIIAMAPSNIQAQDCGSAASVTGDIWTEHELAIRALGCVFGPTCTLVEIAGYTDRMITLWNSLVGNSWAHIGPRRLGFNKTHTGTVVGNLGARLDFASCIVPVIRNHHHR